MCAVLTDSLMFVRVKRIGSGRYAYLVEGVREMKRVRQKTLCYLGPVWKISSGVPDDVRRRAEQWYEVDWDRINEEIRRIPLTYEELLKARRAQYAVAIRNRRPGFRTQGDKPRVEGEFSALSKLAAIKFRREFEQTGEREYRMR